MSAPRRALARPGGPTTCVEAVRAGGAAAARALAALEGRTLRRRRRELWAAAARASRPPCARSRPSWLVGTRRASRRNAAAAQRAGA